MSHPNHHHDSAGSLHTSGARPAASLPRVHQATASASHGVPSGSASPFGGDSITAAEFAAAVGLSRASVYRYIGSPALPDRLVIRAGARKLIICRGAVQHFLEHWRFERGSQ